MDVERERRRSPTARRLGCTLLAAGAGLAAVAAPALGADGTASIQGYGAVLPSGDAAVAGASTSGPGADRASGTVVASAGRAAGVQVRVRARADGRAGRAEGTVVISGLDLLDGRVTAASLEMSVIAASGPNGRRAGLSAVRAPALLVDGRAVPATPGARIPIAGVGTLVLFEEVPTRRGAVRANALRLDVTEPGLAGVEDLVLGQLDASAQKGRADVAPKPAPARAPSNPAAPPPLPTSPLPTPAAPTPAPPPASTSELPSAEAPLVPPAGVPYLFPVEGDSSYTDDYGAPRAVTGTHHGNDIFAPTGTPVVAVTDGQLFKVGVNTLGGNRLWLRDAAGNEFYYAHLSAYAREAVEGATVRAGQVIAFVGNTGQAITTPPHLHFEVHPAAGDAVNPYPYLVAWEQASAVPRAYQAPAVTVPAPAPPPPPPAGAVLVEVEPAVDDPPAVGDGLAGVTG